MTANSQALLILLAVTAISAIIGEMATTSGIMSKNVIHVGQNCEGDKICVPVSFVHSRIGEVDSTINLDLIFQQVCRSQDVVKRDYLVTLVTDMFIVNNDIKAGDLYKWTTSQLTIWAWLTLAFLYIVFSFFAGRLTGIEGPLQLLLLTAGVLVVLVPFFWIYDKAALYSLESLPAAIVGLISAILTFAWNYLTKKNKLTNPG